MEVRMVSPQSRIEREEGGGCCSILSSFGRRKKPSGTLVRGLSPRRAYGMEHIGRGTRSPDLDASGSGALLRRVAAVRIATNFARE